MVEGCYYTTLEALERRNPYLDFFHHQRALEPEDMSRLFDPKLDDSRRLALFSAVDVTIADDYAWAIPNNLALRIIQHYGPVIEIGAGKGYWARLLVDSFGVDILCFDAVVELKTIM